MGELINLNSPKAITDADIPAAIARDSEVTAAINGHLAATDPHLQYPTQARGDMRYLRKYDHFFRAAPSVSQNIIANTPTKIFFDSVTSNVGNQFANSRLTSLGAESWRITTNIECELPTTGRVILQLYKNGGFTKQIMDITCPAGFFGLNITPSDAALLAGDYLEIYALFLIGGGKIYGDANLNVCWWEGSRVG